MEAKTKLSLIDKIILWLNGLLCSALIISYFAPTVDPKKVWEIAFFGLAYPFLLIANIIILMWWLLRGRWYWLVSFICIAARMECAE